MVNLCFFHCSDDYIKIFDPRFGLVNGGANPPVRPLFYWFSDYWYSNYTFNQTNPSKREKYFYLFIKNPKKDRIELRARHQGLGFDGLYKHFLDYQKLRDTIYPEPSILMSFTVIKPELIAKYNEKLDKYTVYYPKKLFLKPISFSLFSEDQKPIQFNKIPELVKLFPEINNSLPFIEPQMMDNQYVYEDWLPMPGKPSWWL